VSNVTIYEYAYNSIPIYASEGSSINSLDKKLPQQNYIQIYPNPVSNKLQIDIKNQEQRFSYKILNNLGQTIQVGTLKHGQNSISTNLLEAGIYYLQTDKTAAKNFVVTR